jgi:hypothetical protein
MEDGCRRLPGRGRVYVTAVVDCKRDEKQDCAPCHMRKAAPLEYLTITDHRIRIYP